MINFNGIFTAEEPKILQTATSCASDKRCQINCLFYLSIHFFYCNRKMRYIYKRI